MLETFSRANIRQVYISFDGPRAGNDNDKRLVDQCREVVFKWRKENETVKIIERSETKNLGCRQHVIKAISWFFEHEENGIIIEDDCLASTEFYKYCSELLHRYQVNSNILMVSGNNYGRDFGTYEYSYSFTRYISIWGWATWKSRWQRFLQFYHWLQNASISDMNTLRETLQSNLWSKDEGNDRFEKMLGSLNGEIDSWGYILSCFALSNHLLTIIPAVNLISNTGFGPNSTNTTNEQSWMAKIEQHPMEFPLRHPPFHAMNWQYQISYQPELRNKSKFSFAHFLRKWN